MIYVQVNQVGLANQKGYLSRSYSSPFENSKSSKAAFPSSMTSPKTNQSTSKTFVKSSNGKGIDCGKVPLKSSMSNPRMNDASKIITANSNSNEQNSIGRDSNSQQK